MTRPRWHDVLIIVAIAGVCLVGVWALWWDDVRDALDLGPGSDAPAVVTGPSGQT